MLDFSTIKKSNTFLAKMRSLILLIQLIFVVAAFDLEMISLSAFFVCSIVISFVFLFNLYFLKFPRKTPLNSIQIFIDFFVTSILLYFSGGYHNPLIIILGINFFIAPLFLSKKEVTTFVIFSVTSLFVIHSSPYTLIYKNINFITLFEFSTFLLFPAFFILSFWIFSDVDRLENEKIKLESFSVRVDRYRALGLLASGVCHELGTPLNTLQLDIDRLKQSLTLDQTQASDIESIQRNITKCTSSLRKLNLQVHDQDNDFYMQHYDLVTEMEHAVLDFNASSTMKITFNKISIEQGIVSIPKVLFFRSLLDIKENSEQAGATQVLIEISHLSNKSIKILITDNGPGFKEEFFEMFGMPFVTTKENGTGLGMYHLHNLLVVSGGEMNITNNNGACIELIIPKVTESLA